MERRRDRSRSGGSPLAQRGEPALAPWTHRDLALYFLRFGTVGFGGPTALAGYMQRDLLEECRWLTKRMTWKGWLSPSVAPPLAE